MVLSPMVAAAVMGQDIHAESVTLEARVDSLMSGQMSAWHIPGAAVAIVEDGDIIVLKGYGTADLATERLVDPEMTLFHVASISKPVTAGAVLQLAEQGRIDLDRPVNEYLRAVKVESPYDSEMTPAHLLTHTGGFDRSIIGRKTRNPDELQDLADFLSRKLPPVIRPPGEISVYSNYGFALAGLLVEDVSGVPFAQYMEENFFQPLGMNQSSFALKPELEEALATGYGWRGSLEPPVPRDYTRTVPASMLRTTAADMARWMLAITGGGQLDGQRLLTTASTRLMLTRQFSNNPHLPGRSYGLSEGARYSPPEFIHAGGTTGFTSALVLLPHIDGGIFVAFNSQAPPWGVVRGILEHYDKMLQKKQSNEPAAAEFDTRRYEGYYRNAEIPVRSMARLGALVNQVRVTSAGPGAIHWQGRVYEAISTLAFQSPGGGQIVAFGESNERIQYFFRQGGEYERISWLSAWPVQAAAWLLFSLTFLGAVIMWGVRYLSGLVRGMQAPDERGQPSRAVSAAYLTSGLNLAFIAGITAALVIQLDSGGVLDYGIPLWFAALLAIPFLTGALSIVLLIAGFTAWRRKWWTLWRRTRYTLWVAIIVAFIPFLGFWNLLGVPGF
jgi:CubicO group peptidase (beta-lactamase class C family)